MEILKNVQLLDDSYLAEVSGGAGFGRAAGKEAAGKFFDTWYGWVVTGVAGTATVALSVLATLFGPKLVAKGCSKLPNGYGFGRLHKYGKAKMDDYANAVDLREVCVLNDSGEAQDLGAGLHIGIPVAPTTSSTDE